MQTILYVCVHNAGRSQMAEASANHIAHDTNDFARRLGLLAGTDDAA